MTDYLRIQSSTQFDTSNTAKVQMSPGVGQYWSPKIIRVGTVIPANLGTLQEQVKTTCTVFHGAAGDTGVDAFVDSTRFGNGDTTGVMSGVVVQPGEFITVEWQVESEGFFNVSIPGATAYVGLYGESSTVPPSQGFVIPEVMGSRFSGNVIDVSQQSPVVPAAFSFLNPGAGANVTIISPNPGQGLYLFELAYTATTLLADSLCNWNSPNAGLPIMFDAFGGSAAPRAVNLGGMVIPDGGLTFHQNGGAAAGGTQINGTVTFTRA